MEIQTISPSIPRQRRRIESFLQSNGLRFDDMDYYAFVVDESTDEIVAGGGLKGHGHRRDSGAAVLPLCRATPAHHSRR